MFGRLLAGAIAGLAMAGAAFAQPYPNKPITLVVPFAAGGPTDTLARNLGVALTASLKQQIVVENVGGAGGTIGVNKGAKAKPDGYTVLLHHIEKDVPARVNDGPIGVAVFADDFKTIRPFAERDNTNIVSWTEHPRGGHFASMEVPDELVRVLREFYAARTA